MRHFGFTQSNLDGTELRYNTIGSKLPEEYELKDLPEIVDQGSSPICMSAVLSDQVNWKLNYIKGYGKLGISDIYDLSKKRIDGLNPKEAYQLLLSKTKYPFKRYAIVGSEIAAKNAILSNGVLMIALPVKSMNNDFWNGNDELGGHAVSLVGWNNDGFILKNSWGTSYGNLGYYNFPYSDFDKIIESWILID